MSSIPNQPEIEQVGAREKSYSEMTDEDKRALGFMLDWKGKPLNECSDLELIDCIIFMTAQTVMLNQKLRDQAKVSAKSKIARLP